MRKNVRRCRIIADFSGIGAVINLRGIHEDHEDLGSLLGIANGHVHKGSGPTQVGNPVHVIPATPGSTIHQYVQPSD